MLSTAGVSGLFGPAYGLIAAPLRLFFMLVVKLPWVETSLE